MATSSQVYRKLQQRLDKLPIGFPATESGVEIRILKHLFTPLEAEIAIDLNFIPEQVDRIYKRVKHLVNSPKRLKEILDEMGKKGSIVRHTTRAGFQVYSIYFLAIGMFEFQVDKLTKEFYKDFLEYLDGEFEEEVLNKKFPQLRPIPTEGSILPEFPVLPYDDIRKIVEKIKGPILAANCICKQGHDMIGKPCQVTDTREVCIILGSGARNYYELGWGKYITKDELKNILEKAEQDGLVLQPSNTKKPFNICLCCGDCCEVLNLLKKQEHPAAYVTSNYYAQVDTDACIGCGICVKRCQMDAIKIVGEKKEKKAMIDLKKCIGCGLCVPTCKPNAMSLQIKTKTIEPPENGQKLYIQILRNKIGNAKMLIMLTKILLKKKV